MRKGPDYTCEWDKAVLSDRGTGEDHISLVIGPDSGKASMATGLIGWRMARLLRPRRYHFCGPVCMLLYFSVVLGMEVPPEYAELAEAVEGAAAYTPPVFAN